MRRRSRSEALCMHVTEGSRGAEFAPPYNVLRDEVLISIRPGEPSKTPPQRMWDFLRTLNTLTAFPCGFRADELRVERGVAGIEHRFRPGIVVDEVAEFLGRDVRSRGEVRIHGSTATSQGSARGGSLLDFGLLPLAHVFEFLSKLEFHPLSPTTCEMWHLSARVL